jgi:hypothetical protein
MSEHNALGREKKHVIFYDTKVKLEAATAVIELMMMGGRTPET